MNEKQYNAYEEWAKVKSYQLSDDTFIEQCIDDIKKRKVEIEATDPSSFVIIGDPRRPNEYHVLCAFLLCQENSVYGTWEILQRIVANVPLVAIVPKNLITDVNRPYEYLVSKLDKSFQDRFKRGGTPVFSVGLDGKIETVAGPTDEKYKDLFNGKKRSFFSEGFA